MKKYGDIIIGEKAEINHTITEKDIRKFVDLTGDDNKLHIDADFAANTSFKKPVAHGMLGASFISTIIGTKLPGDGALWFSQSLEFLMPVRVGDTLTIVAEVIGKNDRNNSIELRTEIYNQNKQKVTTGTAKVKIVEQEIQQESSGEITQEPAVRNILVIGASGGIGQAISSRLVKEGYNLVLHYNNNSGKVEQIAGNKINDNQKISCLKADLNKEAELEELISKAERMLGAIDGVINAATVNVSNIKFEKTDWNDLNRHLQINIKANYELLKRLVPSMKERKKGKIIFITTQYTESTPPAELIHYVTAKSALNGFAKSLAVELGPHNIQVNLVSPGMTETELIADVPEKARLVAAGKTPLRRLASPSDIANVVSFLFSDNSNYITGETIRVNGGQTMI